MDIGADMHMKNNVTFTNNEADAGGATDQDTLVGTASLPPKKMGIH